MLAERRMLRVCRGPVAAVFAFLLAAVFLGAAPALGLSQIDDSFDQIAKIVIDEQSGIIVMGENVRISRVAIAQANLTIRITEAQQISQPNAFANTGTTERVDRTKIEIEENQTKKLGVLDTGISLQDLVNGLNALGVGPRDMITILQTIKTAGALQAEIEVM